MSAPDLTLTTVRRDLIVAADRGEITYVDGWFCIDGLAIPEISAHEARELTFAGLLLVTGRHVTATAEGRAAIR